VAALLVVFYHVKNLINELLPEFLFEFISSSYVAVDFFFVLSGFIICWKYFTDFSNVTIGKKAAYILFIKKRIARIYPLHIVILAAYFIIPSILWITGRDIINRYDGEMILPHILLIQSWGFFSNIGFNIPSWSISTEFLAYLTFPFIAIFIHRTSKLMAVITLTILYGFLIFSYSFNNATSIGEYISSLGWLRCLVGFYFGVMAYFVTQASRNWQCFAVLMFSLIVTVLIACGLPNYYYISLFFTLILLLIIQFKNFFVLFLNHKILQFFGDISYSIYMTHYFVRDLMVMFLLTNNESASWAWLVGYIFLTIVLSKITYNLVEVKLKNKLLKRFL
jgi:peptidoglycan/LPS O-acetylase OafA/YrhL